MQGLLNTILGQDGSVHNIQKICCFIQYASRLKNKILAAQPPSHLLDIVPDFLPISVVNFLASSCVLSEQKVKVCWEFLKELMWMSAFILDNKAVSAAFKDHGIDKGFGLLLTCSITIVQLDIQ